MADLNVIKVEGGVPAKLPNGNYKTKYDDPQYLKGELNDYQAQIKLMQYATNTMLETGTQYKELERNTPQHLLMPEGEEIYF